MKYEDFCAFWLVTILSKKDQNYQNPKLSSYQNYPQTIRYARKMYLSRTELSHLLDVIHEKVKKVWYNNKTNT